MSPKVKIRLTPYELQMLDLMLGNLIEFRNEADAWERCAMSLLLLWHMKIQRLVQWPNPKGNKIALDAPTAYALMAVAGLEEIKPTDPFGNKLRQLSDSIQQTFFSPIS